ncbi:MAG: class I SAM-dependent methyltransferase [Clostridiaceae bacterium]|jgi:ubiquinone/menaquinone biosynthesis C-methylase UbiE|nr:class I SAM-dependent methyltransferase [Clostridiaceae bacterium]
MNKPGNIAAGYRPCGEGSGIYESRSEKQPLLEKMSDFFSTRVDGYDEHMLNEVEGCREGYIKMAELIPEGTESILDLGCGTGLELDAIFRKLPDVSVTGIDLTRAMLDKLREKYPDKNIRLICGDFFNVHLGENMFDAAISFQAMHHFTHAEKVRLYAKIDKALKPSGVYIECDYMVTEQSAEDELFAESERLRREINAPEGEYYHFDTPCTVENQAKMLKEAGFSSAGMVWRMGNTTIIIAQKQPEPDGF